MNDATKPPSELITFAVICGEATRRHGDDWPAIEKYIQDRLNALPDDQRKRLASVVDRVLRYRSPDSNCPTQ